MCVCVWGGGGGGGGGGDWQNYCIYDPMIKLTENVLQGIVEIKKYAVIWHSFMQYIAAEYINVEIFVPNI